MSPEHHDKAKRMFSSMVHELNCGKMPDKGALEKRFDAAMTKKLGVVRLPPSFWMQDPKINPRADHLFWASILIGDRQRIDLAVTVLAVELDHATKSDARNTQQELVATVHQLAGSLLEITRDTVLRRNLANKVQRLLPEYFTAGSGIL